MTYQNRVRAERRARKRTYAERADRSMARQIIREFLHDELRCPVCSPQARSMARVHRKTARR